MIQEANPGKRVGIWIRVSTEEQAAGDSPEHHEHRARYYAEFNGWTVVEVYNLAGVSGKSVWENAECQRMLKDIKRGHIQGLVFSKLARLARNTKELLDFAEHFKTHNAALVSIEEKIDTGTPAGMLFYTMLGAIAQWEREEIASRIKSSVAVRAKLGKPINGSAPYGFRWVDRKLVQVPEEVAIRRQAFELFLQHRRVGVVARLLNAKGARARKGFKFRDIGIGRLLRCTSAKGVYRVNVYRGSAKKEMKPEAEWGSVPCVPIVSEDVFDQVNRILEEQKKPQKKPGKKPAQVFTGLLTCGCGCRMYVYTRSPNYSCRMCKNKIGIAAMEEIFVEAIRDSLADSGKISAHLSKAQRKIAEREANAVVVKEQIGAMQADTKRAFDLYLAGGVSVEQFKTLNDPLTERLAQLQEELPRLEGEISALQVLELSADVIAYEASSLANLWPTLDTEGKQRLAALVCNQIIVPNSDDAPIDIVFSHTPPGAPPDDGMPGSGGGSPPPEPPEGGIFDPSSNSLNSHSSL